MTIYEPKGAAREYAPLAMNYYMGCTHACTYCYCPGVLRKKRETFNADVVVKKDFIRRLEKDAAKLARDDRIVHLCFIGDPYQPIEKDLQITRQALEILRKNRLKPQILTKAGPWAVKRDEDLLRAAGAIWACTLTMDDDALSLEWEPGAPLPGERIHALKAAKEIGLQTWVSLEPVLDPAAALLLVRRVAPYTDVFKVGKLNHHQHAKTIDWALFFVDAVSLLWDLGTSFYIKDDLKAYAPEHGSLSMAGNDRAAEIMGI